jgi:hemin uptake protein HemP
MLLDSVRICLIVIKNQSIHRAHSKGIDTRNTNRYHLIMTKATSVSKSSPVRDAPPPAEETAAPRRVTSGELLGTAAGLVIVHNGREYLLRVTQNGKLILTA